MWLLPDVPLAAAGRRVRHRGLPRHPPGLRRRGRLPPLRRPGAPARHARDRRLRHEPHLQRPPVVPGVALEPRLAQARLVRVVGGRTRYAEARIIFTDTEVSNWTWDAAAGAYYWHRFFIISPISTTTIRTSARRCWTRCASGSTWGWTASGSTPCPISIEREGTNCENLPETHAFLRRVRSHIDDSHPDTVLLAEANQWPADVVEYFGAGDQCHMAFHFPVMPRMFMALRREEARPIYRDPRPDAGDPRQLPVGSVPPQP